MLRRRYAGHIIVGAICTGIVSVLACSGPEPETPRVIFEGRYEQGQPPSGYKPCAEVGALFTVGDFGNPNTDLPDGGKGVASTSKKDGDSEQQGNVGISCSVTPVGPDEFDVIASLNLTGATGGTFLVSGRFKARDEQPNLAITVSKRGSNVSYRQNGACTARYTTNIMGVAAGRVWAEITCPAATNDSSQTACKVVSQFRFENCAQ